MKNLPILLPKPDLPSVRDILIYSIDKFAERVAFIIKHQINKEISYEHITYKRLGEEIKALGTALMARGFADKRMAIMGNNSYAWMLGYFTSLYGLGIIVPLDKSLPLLETEASLSRSRSDIFLFDPSHKKTIEDIKERGKTSLTFYVSTVQCEGYVCISDLISEGQELIEKGNTEFLTRDVDPDALSLLFFTSGTTASSKAVMVSQRNLASNICALYCSEPMYPTDVNMAFLPYHHTFGSTGQLLFILCGASTAFCDGLKYLQKNLVEYKVSVFVCVPLLVESIYKKIMTQAEKQGKRKALLKLVMVSNGLMKVGINLRKILFRSILEQLGGNLRFIVCGAAAIDKVAAQGFNDFGILTVQGFGLTETASVITAESVACRRSGSVGFPLQGVEIKLVDINDEGIGEVITKGPHVMLGYYENQEETDRVMIDGWFHTGDLGRFDKDGYLFLCGRKKNVIVMKNGKNIYPEELEILLSEFTYVAECMVFAIPKNEDFVIGCKIVYTDDLAEKFENHEDLRKMILSDVEKINETIPTYKRIKRVIITNEPTIKTTTIKIKRHEEMKKIEKELELQ